MLWPAATLDAVDAAIHDARNGVRAVLAVEGDAGFGKSTLLQAAVEKLDGFQVLRAFGEQDARDDRFQLLYEWDALPVGAPLPQHTLQAARLLAQVVDRLEQTGPVALVLDDVQWIDPESVNALTALVRRAAGVRLLVLAAYRPLGRRHPAWRQLVESVLRLDGLDGPAAAAFVAALDPAAPAGLAEQLRAHTGGSPLHMRALLQEHPTRELVVLAARGELPAPADLATTLHARVAALAPDAAQLLRALAVLGDAWADLPTGAAVGGVRDADAAVAVLRAEGLLRLDRTPVVPRIRIAHAVVCAAVYEVIPTSARRRLHGAAAARLAEPGARLRHRFAATLGPDEALAADLEHHADELHGRASFREAARFRLLAASATDADAQRRRRQLDAEFEAILAHDDDLGHNHDLGAVVAGDAATAHERLVAAMRLSAAKQWVRAAEVLDGLAPTDVAALDPVNAYRAAVLRGWTIIGAGRPAADALPPLREAAASAVRDPALQGIFTFAYGQAAQATGDPTGPLWGFHDTMATERATLAATSDGRIRLSWRGAAYALTGATTKAVDDLTLVTDLIDDGAMDLGDGAFHALLGFAQWMGGQWRRAAITLDVARAAPRDAPHPVVPAAAPLAALVTGHDIEDSLAASRHARLAGPHPSAVQAGDITDVVVLAYAGTARQRRALQARRVADFGDPHPSAARIVPFLWLLAMGISAAWSEDAEATDAWAGALERRTGGSWRAGAAAWLRALARRARGEPVASRLLAIAREGLPDLPSLEALLWIDAANAAAREGQADAAKARGRAEFALNALEAGPYISALLPQTVPEPTREDPLAPLSDREREVATLVLDGLSYAQIANALFVTRSTVGFHLSNVYAKTGTSSRHELAQLLRPNRRTAS